MGFEKSLPAWRVPRRAHRGPASGPRGRYRLIVATLLVVLIASLTVSACGSSAQTNATQTGPNSTDTQAGGANTTATGGATAHTGGSIVIATEPGASRDPAVASARSDILLNQQIYDWLVDIGPSSTLVPALATFWDSADGKIWTFTLRSDVNFSNGEPFSADDVVYTFKRLQDPNVGSPLASNLKDVTRIEAADPGRVVFTLSEANPEFPSEVADYHAAILCASAGDPATNWVGTGPFVLDSYVAEDRAVLKKNPEYWMKDGDGVILPYLDQVTLVFSPDLAGQVNALQGGQAQFVAGLTSELVAAIKADPDLQVIEGQSSAFHYVIHMRSDAGHPAADERIRQALQLGTDHQGLIDQVRPGLAVVGNGTPVGPSYGDYYLDEPPVYDPAKAKQLLTEAGASDLNITLYAQNALEVPAIATVWKEQMKAIGVTVDIKTVPPDVYYGEGDGSWLKVDFGITEWGARATPLAYFNAAYVTGAAYNESHWSDAEFDSVVAQLSSELDREKRIELYRQAQQIMIDRGPVIVPFFETAAAGASAALQGVVLAPDWSRTTFRTAYLSQ